MVEDMDFLKRSDLLETINVAARRYISITNKHGFSDHSVIKLTSFSSVQKQFSMTSAILKSHVVISTNLIGYFYWQLSMERGENRGNGQTWRMPANLITDIGHARYRRFYTPIAAIDENRNRGTGHIWRFMPIAAIGV